MFYKQDVSKCFNLHGYSGRLGHEFWDVFYENKYNVLYLAILTRTSEIFYSSNLLLYDLIKSDDKRTKQVWQVSQTFCNANVNNKEFDAHLPTI